MPHAENANIAAAAEGNFDGLLAELTTREKIDFLAGANFWETAAVDRLGIPSLKVGRKDNSIEFVHSFADNMVVQRRSQWRSW